MSKSCEILITDGGGFSCINPAMFAWAFAQDVNSTEADIMAARTMTKKLGKTIKEARSEVDKCAWAMDYFAFINDEVIYTDARKSVVMFEPLGVIGSIMLWNFPYWQALRFAAPSIMFGNTIVLKPAIATMGCGIEIEKAFSSSGVPDGVFQTISGDSSIPNILIDSEDINAVTFTGSVTAGDIVAQRATSQIKKCVLEMGGSDPFVVY